MSEMVPLHDLWQDLVNSSAHVVQTHETLAVRMVRPDKESSCRGLAVAVQMR